MRCGRNKQLSSLFFFRHASYWKYNYLDVSTVSTSSHVVMMIRMMMMMLMNQMVISVYLTHNGR